MASRDNAYDNLLAAAAELGYPEELGVALAAELRGEWSMKRMAAYLRQARPRTMEEIADEALAIVEQRDSWVRRKINEHAQEELTAFYNRERGDAE